MVIPYALVTSYQISSLRDFERSQYNSFFGILPPDPDVYVSIIVPVFAK